MLYAVKSERNGRFIDCQPRSRLCLHFWQPIGNRILVYRHDVDASTTSANHTYVGDSIENELRQLGAKPAKSVSGKTQVFAIGHNADMSETDPAREKGIPIMAVADLLEVLER